MARQAASIPQDARRTGQIRSRRIFLALHDTIDAFSICRCSCSTICSMRSSQDVTTTRYETWAGGARLLPPIGQSGRPPGAEVERLSRRAARRAHRTRSAPRCSSPTSGRTWRSTGHAAGSMCRKKSGDRIGAETVDARCRADDARSGRRRFANAAAGRGRCLTQGATGLRRRVRPPALRAARDVAWRQPHPRSSRAVRASTCSRARPKLGAADALVIACGTLLWRATPPSPTRS